MLVDPQRLVTDRVFLLVARRADVIQSLDLGEDLKRIDLQLNCIP